MTDNIHFPFHVEIESAPEYHQMQPIDLQRNIELKHIFETSESKIDFYKTYVTKDKYSNLRNLAQKVDSFFLNGLDQGWPTRGPSWIFFRPAIF